jgi:hypothetical protein
VQIVHIFHLQILDHFQPNFLRQFGPACCTLKILDWAVIFLFWIFSIYPCWHVSDLVNFVQMNSWKWMKCFQIKIDKMVIKQTMGIHKLAISIPIR